MSLTAVDILTTSDDELIRRIREAGAHWFNNDQLLLLEELIRRAQLGRLGQRGS
jgi:hypothetical protein